MLKHFWFVFEEKLNRAVVLWVPRWQLCLRWTSLHLSCIIFFLELLPYAVQTLLFLQPQDEPDQGVCLELSKGKEKKMQRDFSAGFSSTYDPNFILCFVSKSSLMKHPPDKSFWSGRVLDILSSIWHLVRSSLKTYQKYIQGSSTLIVFQLVVHPYGTMFFLPQVNMKEASVWGK